MDNSVNHPGMFSRIWKAIKNEGFGGYLESTVAATDNLTSPNGKARDFNPTVAVNNFFSLVYAAAEMNANAVARTPLRLYGRVRGGKRANFDMRRVNSRKKAFLCGDRLDRPSTSVISKIGSFGDDFKEVMDHPALDLLRGVGGWFQSYDMTKLRVLYLELTGNNYYYVRKGGVGGKSFPSELWPMPSQWVKVFPSRNENDPIISGYRYGRTEAEANDYTTEEVIRWSYPNPRNLYYGLGKVEAAWGEVSLRNSKRQHDQALFDNGCRPDYAVLMKNAPVGEMTRFQKEVEQRMRGTKNRGKFLTINAEQASVMPLTFTEDQLGDQDRVIEAICNVFGVPVAKFLSNKNVAGGQAGVSDAAYLRDTVLPICRMDEETLNAYLLPMFDGASDDLCFAYDNPVPEDREAQRADDTFRIESGVITRDEWREDNGFDLVGGNADELMVPMGLVGINASPPDPTVNENRQQTESPKDDELEKSIQGLYHTIGNAFEKQSDAIAKALGRVDVVKATPTPKTQKEKDDEAEQRRRELLALLILYFAWHRDALKTGADKAEAVAKLAAVLQASMSREGIASAIRFVNSTDDGFIASIVPIIGANATEDSVTLAALINGSTDRMVADSIAAGKPVDVAIDDAIKVSMEDRASVIAGDALWSAGQSGRVTAATVTKKRLMWETAEDDRVCPVCSPLDGVVVDAGQPFAVGVYVPVRDTHPNCRCEIMAAPEHSYGAATVPDLSAVMTGDDS